jgi:stage II sporulation protein GA (sporulation sigma-E factor processing peptidase)
MEVYVDVLLLQNFIVNLFLLYIVMQTIRIRAKLRNMILSAALGAAYVLTLILPELKILTVLPVKIIMAFIMIFVILGAKNLWQVFKASVLYIIYSMLLCGFIVFIELNKGTSWLTALNTMNFTYKSTVIALMLLYIILHRCISYVRDRNTIHNFTYIIEVGMDNFNAKIKAFLDTGNELKEPVTNLPVIIIERDILQGIQLGNDSKLYIPYKVINGATGRIEAFKPTYVKLYVDEDKFEYINAVIGLCDGHLSDVNDYNALLSRGIL